MNFKKAILYLLNVYKVGVVGQNFPFLFCKVNI